MPHTGTTAPCSIPYTHYTLYTQVAGNSVEVTGFHAKRCEFDPEFDQEAECIVAGLEFLEEDTDAEVQVRIAAHGLGLWIQPIPR